MQYDLIVSMKGVAESFSKMSAESYEEYIDELKNGDIINIISVYLKAKYRDKIGYLAKESVRTLFHDIFTKACRRITINKQMVLDRMDKVDKSSFGEHHFDDVSLEIEIICDELRELNKDLLETERKVTENILKNIKEIRGDDYGLEELLEAVEILENIEDIEDLSPEDCLSHEEIVAKNGNINITFYDILNNVVQELNMNYLKMEVDHTGQVTNSFKVGVYHNSLIDRETNQYIPYQRQYIISQFPGQNEINLGVYVGERPDGVFYLIPLGVKNINIYYEAVHKEKAYLNSKVQYYNDIDSFCQGIIKVIVELLKYRDRLKKEI